MRTSPGNESYDEDELRSGISEIKMGKAQNIN
jgi:hypothetical protein